MALSIGNKAQRILRFLLALRHERVRAAMARFGFGDAEAEDGWKLLKGLGRGRMLRTSGNTPAVMIAILDTWENTWFPIIGASLNRHHPAVHARYFLNLSQTEGPEVVLSVQTMIERLDEMETPEGPYGAEGPKARKLLASRGLTAEAVDEARALVTSVPKAAATVSLEDEAEASADAEDAAWKWYLEWSQVARVAIKNRVLLRHLGFLKSGGGAELEGEEEEEEVEPPATPPGSAAGTTTPSPGTKPPRDTLPEVSDRLKRGSSGNPS